jgi:hypothetical protein
VHPHMGVALFSLHDALTPEKLAHQATLLLRMHSANALNLKFLCIQTQAKHMPGLQVLKGRAKHTMKYSDPHPQTRDPAVP